MAMRREDSPESGQDKASLRPGNGQRTEHSVFQRADAQTVMFATARALPVAESADALAEPVPLRPRHHLLSGGRRTWLSRAALGLVLLLQALLTLRMHNTAFEDEALYLYVGHLEIAHFLHGASLQGNYPSYFSGAPVLYPVIGALADSVGGLAAARAVSLLEMLTATVLVYAMARRLFNERVALCAAAIFSVTEPTLFLGNLATYDASALFLLAVAAWVVVRTAEHRWPLYLLAAPVLVLAVATKYAALLWVPCVIALSGLVAWPRLGRKAIVAPLALTGTTIGLLAGVIYIAGPDYWHGITSTTLARTASNASATSLIWDCAQWIGLPVALAVIGTVGYTIRPATDTAKQVASAGSRLRRAALGIVLTGSALLAPADQVRIHTFVSLQKHVGFGLLFAAPIAGVGLARVIGEHFRRMQIGVAVWGTVLTLGMAQANGLFHVWPNSSAYVADLARYLAPGARYLVEVDEVPIYYLRNHSDAQPDQFVSTFYFQYDTKQGRVLTGDPAYTAAIKAGYFRVVAFNYSTTPSTDEVIDRALVINPKYRLANVVPQSNGGNEYIWVRNG